MVYCQSCRAKLASGAKFCQNCGTSTSKIIKEEFSVSSEDLVKKVKQLIHEGNITRVIVKDEKGKTLIEIPVTVGVIGAVLVPWLAALGAIAAFTARCTVVVERRE
ncbi:MAG: DUF4342 domain-containing protein [Methanobacteriota archaeon]